MTVDQRLRDATRAYTERIEPSIDGWQRLTDRLEPRRRRPWLVALAGFTVVLLVVATLFAVARRNSGDEFKAAGVRYPKRFVSLTSQGLLVVRSSRTADYVRMIASGVVVEGGEIAVPDRTSVYFLGKGRESGQCGPGLMGNAQVLRVPLTGGHPRNVVTAPAALDRGVASFDVSPDGTTLAVAIRSGRCEPSTSITTIDVATGRELGHWGASSLPNGTTGGVTSLVWSPDSKHLMFVWEVGSTYPWILDTEKAISLNDAHRVAIDDGSRLSGYLGSTGDLLGMRFTVDGRRQVWSFDSVTGARKRLLFCCGDPLVSDRTGRAILAESDHGLVRWSEGDRNPTELVPGYTLAVWVPSPRS